MASTDKTDSHIKSPSKTGGGTPRKKPKLLFMRNSQRQGFTGNALSRLSGNSARAIRELVQNSLDAAVERGADIAEVRFIVKETNCADVPGIEEYKVALNSAKDFLKGTEQTNSVVKFLAKSVKQNKFYTLFVLDNGIGFDKDRLTAMYDDGISEKEEGAIGAYGNGHFTAFPLSGLQYVLYGGINKGTSILGGHAIIASHIGSDAYRYGKDGYFVAGLKHACQEDEEPYIFPDEGYEHGFICDQMKFIQEHWKSGSVIAVPAFNHFEGELDDVKDLIIQNVAMNFFVAIHNEKLRITVSINGEKETLFKENLESVLDKCKEQVQSSIKGFPSGIVAWNSYQTLIHGDLGEKGIIDTPKGKVELRIRIGDGNKDVALCRDGMWVTREVPKMSRRAFTNKESFDALLLIDKDNDTKIYKLLKKAEGPDHIDIRDLPNRMGAEERREFNKCLEAIVATIKSMVGNKEGEIFEPQDFITFQGGQSISSARTMNSSVNKLGKAAPVSRLGERIRAGKKGKKTSKSALKSGNVLDVKISSKRRNQGKADICFEPIKECEDVEFRMQVDRGRDSTCTGQLDKKDWEEISLKRVKIGDQVIPADRFLPPDSDKKFGVYIGAVAAKPYNMTVEYDAPPSMLGDHAIRWIFIRRKKSSPVAEGA